MINKFFYMKRPVLLLAILGFLSHKASAQGNNQQLFNESGYAELSRGFDPELGGKLYAVNYKSTQDSTYTMKKVFRDSAATKLIAKSFYRAGVPEGPFFRFAESGEVEVKGQYKNGTLNGERLTYHNGIVVQEAHFQNGRKRGAWKEYNKQGQLKRTTTYDNQENIQSIQAPN